MDFSQLLNQVLGAAQKGGKAVADSPLNSFGGGALTGALASMLLKKKNTKKLVKAGSVAALGFLAYKGYQNWKQNRQQDELPQSAFQPAGLIGENHSRVILQTMIAAAASDGLIDDAERAAIERESGSDAETRHGCRRNMRNQPLSSKLPLLSAAMKLWQPKLIWRPDWSARTCRVRKLCS